MRIEPIATSDDAAAYKTSATEEVLPLSIKVCYGAPSFAGAALAIPIIIHLTIFYSDTILVPLGLIALVKAVARSLDAITDPVMGWISDRTRTRWGRRRPWIVLGAPLAAGAFYLMFTPPESLDVIEAATWFAVTYTLYYVFHTIYVIPHSALGPELTLSYGDRSNLFGIREGFVVTGTLIAAVTPPILIGYLGGVREGYSAFAIIFGSLLVILYLNLVINVKERQTFMTRESNPLIPGVRRVMRNRVFRILLLVYLVGSIMAGIPGLMIPYFTKYVLQPENPDLWLAVFLGLYFASGLVFLPAWIWAAKKFDKKPVWLAGFVPGMLGSSLLFLMGEGDLAATMCVLVISGSGLGVGLFLGASMQADVIDYDELHTGKRREAQYGALWSIMTKFMVIPSMSVPLAILAGVGYVPNIVQTEDVQLTMRLIFCLGPAGTAVIAFCLGWRYPISRQKHAEIIAGIRAHEAGQAVTDPITGHEILPPDARGVDESLGWQLDHFSLGELDTLVNKGRKPLVNHILICSVLSFVGLVVCIKLLIGEITLAESLGLLPVIYVVFSGLSFTALLYHLKRLREAVKMTLPEPATMQLHIDVTRNMKHGIQ